MLRDSYGVDPVRNNPQPAAAPEPPVSEKLAQAPAEEAQKTVKEMTPPQKEELKQEYDKKSAAEKQEFANTMADKLDGQSLSDLQKIMGDGSKPVFDGAAERSGQNKEGEYQQAQKGLNADTASTLGLSSADVEKVTQPVAERLNAIAADVRNGNAAGAAEKIALLKEDSLPLARQVLTSAIDSSNAPQSVKDFVKNNGPLMESVLQAGGSAVTSLLQGNVGQAVSDLTGNAQLQGQVIDAFVKDPKVAAALEKLGGVAADKLKTAEPKVIDALAKAADGNWKEAAIDLATAAADGSEFAKSLTTKALQAVDNLPQSVKNILNDPKLQSALAGAGGDVARALLEGKPEQALSAIKDPALLSAVADVAMQQEPVKSALSAAGIDPESVKKAGDAAPDLINAAMKLKDGKPTEALKDLANAVGKAPEVVADLAAKIGEKLPGDDAGSQMLKSILGNKELVGTLLGNPDLQQSVKDLFSGNITEGLKGIGNNEEANKAVAKHIANADDPITTGIRDKLNALGLTSEADFASFGPVLADAIALGENVAKGKDMDVTDALLSIGKIANGLPEGARDQLVDRLIDPLYAKIPGLDKIPEEYKDLFKAVATGVTNEEHLRGFIENFGKLPSDPTGFAQGLITSIAELSKDGNVAVSLLNALGTIGDGQSGIGAFFNNPDFNQRLVDAGVVSDFFGAVQSLLVNGDIQDAVGKLGGIIPKLLDDPNTPNFTIPDKIKTPRFIPDIPIPLIGGNELPLDGTGIDTVGMMFEQFYGALPDDAKNKIESKKAELVEKVTRGGLPGVGDVWSIMSDAKDGISNLASPDGNKVEGVFDLTSALVQTGALIPPLAPVARPLAMIVSFGQTYIEVSSTIKDNLDVAKSFGIV